MNNQITTTTPRATGNDAINALYYHKTQGGAEYLTDRFILCADGNREGIFGGAQLIIRIDGNIAKDAEVIRNGQCEAMAEAISKLRGAVDRLRNCPDLCLDGLEASTLDALEEASVIMDETYTLAQGGAK